jgi:HEAT repeat protein
MEYSRRILVLMQLLIVTAALAVVPLCAQQIIHHPNNLDPLEGRWAWAWKEVAIRKPANGFWIGYGIQRWMGQHSLIGSFRDDSGDRDVSLHELLYGQKESLTVSGGEESLRREAEKVLERRSGHKYMEPKVLKGVAMLFGYGSDADEPTQPRKIVVCNLSTSPDLQNRPLFWLGRSRDGESVAFLRNMFDQPHTERIRESLVFAISLHDSSDRALRFLRDVLTGGESERIRGSAAFFLGERDHEEDVTLLVKLATHDASRRVRDQSVFGLSRMQSDVAVEALIELAKHCERKDVREKAIFWIGQKASDRALVTLKEIAFSDDETGIQRQAVFALSRLKNDDGVKELIEIAKSHKSSQIRREAMFWLGRSDDPRAFDFLVRMIRRK